MATNRSTAKGQIMRVKSLIESHVIYVIPFYDLDPLCIVWHGNYLKYFEKAREELLMKIGYSYGDMAETDYIFPIVESHVKYISPLVHAQEIKVTAMLVEYENRIKIAYKIVDNQTGKKCTEGYTTQVTVIKSTKELEFQSPDNFIEKVKSCLEK